MKKLLTFIIFWALGLSSLCAQTRQQVKQLATLAKVWGFLKYYHPGVANGSQDWDAELIKMIPLAKAAPSAGDFDKLVAGWYHALPAAKLSDTITQVKRDTIIRVFDEHEIGSFGVPKELESEFTKLYLYHLPGPSKYINNFDGKYRYDYIFHNEREFAKPAFPDEEHRLLALFRYWNIINYFYPHKKINAPGWDKVLADFIPQFIAAQDSNEYRRSFIRLTARLKDSHSFFSQREWNNFHETMNLTFTTYYIDGRFFIGRSRYDSLMMRQDFKIGDEIVSINNKPVSERVKELTPYTTGTNQLSFYRNIANRFFKIDTARNIQVGIKREGQYISKTARLFTEGELYQYRKGHQLKLWEDFGNGIWYVRICEITNPDTLKKLFADLQKAKTVIWEMRAYPNFKVMQQVSAGLFASTNQQNIDYNGILEFPGAFAKHNSAGFDKVNSIKLPLYTGKMIVLVSEETQSLSESVAAELRSRPNTVVIGRQTAGTTGNILFVDYPGGITASFTGVGVEGLNGSFKEGQGVKIDKEIKLVGKDLTKYPDYMLEMAYREALGK